MTVRLSFPADRPDLGQVPPAGLGRGDLDDQERAPHWSLGQYVFLILAALCLGFYSYAYIERVVYQTYESWSFDRTAARTASAAGAMHEVSTVRPIVPAPGEFMASLQSPFPASVIGRLSIPRLHLSAMVREGVDGKTLRVAVGHIPSTALPGQAGNVGVAVTGTHSFAD